MFPNRTMCDVLKEMRKCCATGNYSYLPGLIEEVQVMGNRMEAGLSDKEDVGTYRDSARAAYKEWQALKKKIKELEDVQGKTDED